MKEQQVSLWGATLPLSVWEGGQGTTFLLLHGGAGPVSMQALAQALEPHGQVVMPIHPGFADRARPTWFRRVDDLVAAYLTLIDRWNLSDVVLVGNSFGGWVGAELALRGSPAIRGQVLLNAVGIDPGNSVIVDPTTVAPADRARMVFFDPAKSFGPPNGGAEALKEYSGPAFMHDPTLRERLAGVKVPSLVAWGTHDRIVDEAYGRRWAAALPGSRYEPVAEAGHFPQVEQTAKVVDLVVRFSAGA